MKFFGYRRADGRVGTRNHVLILPTVVCANQVVESISHLVKGTVYFTHQHGCAQLGKDLEQTIRTLVGYASNPNVYGVLVVGLGCEGALPETVSTRIKKNGKPVNTLVMQEHGGTLGSIAAGARMAADLVQRASMEQRVECDISEILLGTECGGSDACSGLSANPVLGYVSDKLVDAGGTVILAETTELIGAEHLLARRAASPEVARDVMEAIRRTEEGANAMGVDMRGSQPSPGNIEGGLTTIEEKSLGCIHKAGSKPLQEVIPYASSPCRRGLVMMDTPGQDIEQITGMVAGGANVVIFTTGRGTATGTPIAPVIKVASNKETLARMGENIDFSAETVISGEESIEEVGERLFQELLAVCSGKLTKSEIFGHHEFAINRIGPTI
ncbi:MAG TPA: UxaA family hydrolase [Firmicutes bacterium]|nr:UxaA family hydrolase [Bacillota bacterium]